MIDQSARISAQAAAKLFKITQRWEWELTEEQIACIYRPNFEQTIRLLPLIGEMEEWKHGCWEHGRVTRMHAGRLTTMYMLAKTEEAGIEKVSQYLLKIL